MENRDGFGAGTKLFRTFYTPDFHFVHPIQDIEDEDGEWWCCDKLTNQQQPTLRFILLPYTYV